MLSFAGKRRGGEFRSLVLLNMFIIIAASQETPP